MPRLTTSGDAPVELNYTDSGGDGRPMVLVHGWPLSGESFADNQPALTAAGLRVITYDRRGFGHSDKPATGYHYDRLASDLHDLISGLDLRDAVLLGFSMGGGEVARYCSTYGTDRLAGVVLSGSICPALAQADDNPDGAMPFSEFQKMSEACAADHPGFVDQFVTNFFSNAEGLTVAEDVRSKAVGIGLQSDPQAAAECILIWATDLREDCRRIDVPTLLIHGDGDQNVPLAASSARAVDIIPNARLHVVAGGPHGINVSHRDEWERALLDFVGSL
ncbi:alpha/beta hydrolase [Tessaracoccus sp. OS52]|uniref:alpha/beta fold hydrolase n=1 Tax=Tessaracoccus sp. OS52 TaxID=2886691 RepID=UPI001D128F3E|nr:alpha/beta hydrolase [Tessaracoccus sp. OS52]MCC2593333.1 alpha/beta hydrolase [Tessaracoccus sp. OS52]